MYAGTLVAPLGQDEPVQGMHHGDEKLEEMLRLARGCVRGKRVPGQAGERDLFDRWDAEEGAAVSAQPEDPPLPLPPPSPPPLAPTPEGLSPEAHAAKLRRDIQTLERNTSQKRQELEALHAAMTREVLERCRGQDELRAARSEVQRVKRAVREVKGMFRIQEREIQELRAVIAEATKPTQTGRGGAASHTQMATAVVAPEPVPSQPLEAIASPAVAPRGLPGAPLTAAELKEVLRSDKLPSASEAKIWGHLQSENDKLASVIDAVGDLKRQLNDPRSGRAGPGASGVGVGAGSLGPVGITGVVGPMRPAKDLLPAQFVGYTLPGGLPLPPRKKEYASVLLNKPKHYKIYM